MGLRHAFLSRWVGLRDETRTSAWEAMVHAARVFNLVTEHCYMVSSGNFVTRRIVHKKRNPVSRDLTPH